MNKQANNAVENANNEVLTLHPVVLRLNPISKTPLVFIADKAPINGRVEMVAEGGQHMIVDDSFYSHTLPLPEEMVDEVAHAYADTVGVPFTALHIRSRLPKKITKRSKPRHTNDANLNGSGQPFQRRASDKQEQPKQEAANEAAQGDELATMVQQLHDQETGANKEETVEKGVATASNPEGATVVPLRQKRAYNKRSTEEKIAKANRSKKSQAALKRYHEELQKTSEQNDVHVEAAASSVSAEEFDKATLEFALKLAKILKEHKDVL